MQTCDSTVNSDRPYWESPWDRAASRAEAPGAPTARRGPRRARWQRKSVPRGTCHRKPYHHRPLHRTFTKRVPRNPKWVAVRPKACECDAAGHGKANVARYAADDSPLVSARGRPARGMDGVSAATGAAEAGLLLPAGRAGFRDGGGMHWASAEMAARADSSVGGQVSPCMLEPPSPADAMGKTASGRPHLPSRYQEPRAVPSWMRIRGFSPGTHCIPRPARTFRCELLRNKKHRPSLQPRNAHRASKMHPVRGFPMLAAAVLLWPCALASPITVHRRRRAQTGAENHTQIFCHGEVSI